MHETGQLSFSHKGAIRVMPLHLYSSIRESGSVPLDWKPQRGGTLKYHVKNAKLHSYLQELLAGK
jgi:hypothetical protein